MKRITFSLFVVFLLFNINFIKAQGCDIPAGLAVDSVTDTKAYIHWNAGASDSIYIVNYINLDNQAAPLKYKKTGNHIYEIDNLNPLTHYEVQIESFCTYQDKSGYCNPVQFQTRQSKCPLPTNLIAYDITSFKAWLKWNGSPNALYTIKYKALTDTIWRFRQVTPGNDLVALNGLTGGTAYEWMLKSICIISKTNEEIFYVDGGVFQTPISNCSNPNIIVPVVDSYQVTLTWDSSPTASDYVVRLHVVGDNNTNDWRYKKVTTNQVTIKMLVANTQYEVQIKTICDSSKLTYSAPTFFTTLPKPECEAPDTLSVKNVLGTQATLKWNQCLNAETYVIEYYKAPADPRVHYRITNMGSLYSY